MKLKKKAKKLAKRIRECYRHFKIEVDIIPSEISRDGERTIFRVDIKQGTKLNCVFGRAEDVQVQLQLHLLLPFREDNIIYLAVSKKEVENVSLVKMLMNPAFNSVGHLPIALGTDMRMRMYYADLSQFPHGMYGGSTGSGKSIGLRSAILSLAYKQPVEKLNLILIDTAVFSFEVFSALPQLSYPIIDNPDIAVSVLISLSKEMERRASLSFDERRLLPAVVCFVDEYLHLLKELEKDKQEVLKATISSLLRMGRHAKIHIILATQEPARRDMLISLSNVTSRMAFRCSNHYVSQSILGESGAEKLRGKGAMIFKTPDQQDIIYLQGSYISLADTVKLVDYIASKHHDISNKYVITEEDLVNAADQLDKCNDSAIDHIFQKILADITIWCLRQSQVSVHTMEKDFKIGRSKATRAMDYLFEMGIVSAKDSNKPRVVLVNELDTLPEEVLNLMLNSGITEEQIQDALMHKNSTLVI